MGYEGGVSGRPLPAVRRVGSRPTGPPGPGLPPLRRGRGTLGEPDRPGTEVLTRIAAGQSNRQIAQALALSEKTVETHVGSLLSKLEVTSRTAAAARAWALVLP